MLLGWSYDKITFTPEMKKLGLEEVQFQQKEKMKSFCSANSPNVYRSVSGQSSTTVHRKNAAAKLAKKPPFGSYFNLCQPIENFGDNLWAYQTLKEDSNEAYASSLIGLLTPEQREEINFQTDSKSNYIPEPWYNEDGTQWGIKFSTRALQRLFHSNYYYYPKEMAERLSLYFPPEMLPKVEQQAVAYDADHTIAKFCRLTAEYMRMKAKK